MSTLPSSLVGEWPLPLASLEPNTKEDPSNDGKALFRASKDIMIVYNKLVDEEGLWDSSFFRGRRNRRNSVEPGAVRRITTRYLGSAATDGWNVIVGAIELARIWGLNRSSKYDQSTDTLDFETRMRLAVCLSLSWKFQRCQYACFPRPFIDSQGEEHSLELAYIAHLFMLTNEAALYGKWPLSTASFAALQIEQVDLEVDLLLRRSLWSCMTENPQVLCELKIEALQSYGVLGHGNPTALMHRALVPFFVRALLLPRRELYLVYGHDATRVASAILCCVILCLDMSMHTRKRVMLNFELSERHLAAIIIATVHEVAVDESDPSILWEGCYGDVQWPLSRFVSKSAMSRLYRATHTS